MNFLFVHEAKTVKDIQGNIYTDTSYSMEVWNRYLKFCDSFTLLLRQEEKNLTTNEASAKYNIIDLDKIKFIKIPNLSSSISSFINLKKRRELREIIRENVAVADCVIVRLPCYAGHLALKYAKKSNKKYLVEVVGDPLISLWYHGSITGKILAPFSYIRLKCDLRKSKNVIYVSQRFLQNRYPAMANAIGIPDVFLNDPSKEVLKKRISKINSLNKSTIKLGLIGSLNVAYRGHEVLLRTGSVLKKKGINVEIHFLGNGDIQNMMNKASQYSLENEVFCDGVLPSGEPVYEWIDKIDILVMPTKAETLGRAIIEAMSRGCPVIGSLETAICEQIGYDCLTYSDDYDSISNLILKMMNNKDYMRSCAYENYYRSFKYTTKQTDAIRDEFIKQCIESEGNK